MTLKPHQKTSNSSVGPIGACWGLSGALGLEKSPVEGPPIYSMTDGVFPVLS